MSHDKFGATSLKCEAPATTPCAPPTALRPSCAPGPPPPPSPQAPSQPGAPMPQRWLAPAATRCRHSRNATISGAASLPATRPNSGAHSPAPTPPARTDAWAAGDGASGSSMLPRSTRRGKAGRPSTLSPAGRSPSAIARGGAPPRPLPAPSQRRRTADRGDGLPPLVRTNKTPARPRPRDILKRTARPCRLSSTRLRLPQTVGVPRWGLRGMTPTHRT